jgi:hypothetical protein
MRINPSKKIKKELADRCTSLQKAGKKIKPVVLAAAKEFGYSVKTIYRWLAKHGFDSGRKMRCDAGKMSETRLNDLRTTAKIYHLKKRINAKESKMPLERARELGEIITGRKFDLPGVSQMHQLLRRLQISRKHAQLPEATTEMVSEYANQVHSLDFSVANFYLDPKDNLIPMWRRDFYPGKPEKWFKKRQLRLMMLTDHLSGAFVVLYYTNQKLINIADFLFYAWSLKKNGKFIFHGIPDILLIDNDKALHSYALQRLFSSLGITVPHLEPYHPWAKGSVEKHIDIWQRWFESTFLLEEFKPKGIDKINEYATAYATFFQLTRKHTRHNKTRFEKWNECIGDHLRELPDETIYKRLIYSDPVVRTVKGGKFEFEGEVYKVKGINNTKIDVYVHAFLYEENKAVTIQYPSKTLNLDNFLKTDIQTLTVLPDQKNQDGLSVVGTKFGSYEIKEPSKTQQEFQKIEETQLPEKAKGHPFIIDERVLPSILPRKGKTVKVTSEIDYKEIEFNLHQAKKKIVSLLGRRLKEVDIDIINSFGKETFNEEDIDQIVLAIQEKLLDEKLA